jgi:hypothetical protein
MFITEEWKFVTRRTVIKLQLKWLSCFILSCRGGKHSRFLAVSSVRCYEFHYFYIHSITDIRQEKDTHNFSFILTHHLMIPGSVSVHASMTVTQYCTCIQHRHKRVSGNGVRITAVLTSILDEDERSVSCSGSFNTVKEPLVFSR